jgi:hypothetical protein
MIEQPAWHYDAAQRLGESIPSVNLTRNSVPHLPGMARYAHNALPGKRVTLPRAGCLKR